jgi:RNA polymerase sigma factor (sigma-70 family)
VAALSRRLSDEQREFVTKNHNLIYSFLKANNLEIEEWYDLAAIGLCKAALTYKDDVSKFSTYAYKCMWNQVMMEKRKQRAICRADDKAVLYYDAMFDCGFDGDECSFLSLIPDLKCDTGRQAEIRLILYEIYQGLNEKDSMIFNMLIRGYTQKQICSRVGCCQPTISRFQKKLRQLYK